MKKIMVISLGLLLVMSSCGTYEATGAYTGAQFGSIIGSAIGGITGGWRGHDIGAIVGMAGGAAVGAAIGKAADNQAERRYSERVQQRQQRYEANESGFDPEGRGDDRIMIDGFSSAPTVSAPIPLEIRNAHFVDASRDGYLTRGEAAHVVFEIYNPSTKPAFGVQPSVTEVTGNKHVHISENILVECIQSQQSIRYTAQVKADNGLKNGEAVIRVSVFQGGKEISSQSRNFRVVTTKR